MPMKRLGRSVVFFDTGACGCSFGHAVSRAGLKQRLAPFFIRGGSGKRDTRWRENREAYFAATGDSPGDTLIGLLENVETANDVPTGEERRYAVVAALRVLAGELDRVTA